MSPFDLIVALRKRGAKPRYVMLDLVPGKPVATWCTQTGAVHAEIGSAQSIAELDFRPLVGLSVQLGDRAGCDIRLRRAAKAIAEANPSLLAVFTEHAGGLTMHRRFADGRTDRKELPPCP